MSHLEAVIHRSGAAYLNALLHLAAVSGLVGVERSLASWTAADPWSALTVVLAVYALLWQCARLWPGTRPLLLAYTLLTQAVYLAWRASATLVFSSPLAAAACALLFAAELFGFVQLTIFYKLHGLPYDPPEAAWPRNRSLPTVDVLVPTYNEPASVLRRTLTACAQIDYPAHLLRVHACDDGGRSWVRQMAEGLGLGYLARPTHEHAKAGNLNYALARTDGDLVLVLDADMVPKSCAVRSFIGFFRHPRVGFVQAPQVFFNPDPFQHNLRRLGRLLPNEQDYFMRDLLPRRARWNAVMFCGTNAMFSRRALMHIGGFTTGSVTEDVATGLELQAAGYFGAYLRKVIAIGMAPESFEEMVHQRDRWCRGSIQVARQSHVMGRPGLTLWQRLAYFSGFMYWYSGLQKLIFLAAPLLYLLGGVLAFRATVAQVLLISIPAFAMAIGTFTFVAENKRTLWWSHVYDLSLAPFLAWAAICETLGLRVRGFRVTRKGVVSDQTRLPRPFWVLLAFAAASVLAIVHGVQLLQGHHLSGAIGSSVLINLGWATYNLLGLLVGCAAAVEWPRRRQAERRRLLQFVHVSPAPPGAPARPGTAQRGVAGPAAAGTGSAGPGSVGPGALEPPGEARRPAARHVAVLVEASETGGLLLLPDGRADELLQAARFTLWLGATPVPVRPAEGRTASGDRLAFEFSLLSQPAYATLFRWLYDGEENSACPDCGSIGQALSGGRRPPRSPVEAQPAPVRVGRLAG